MAEQRKKLRLGELLVQQGLITTDQLAILAFSSLARARNRLSTLHGRDILAE